MQGKRILSVVIFLGLLALSVFAGLWFYNKYMKPTPEPTPDNGGELCEDGVTPKSETTPCPTKCADGTFQQDPINCPPPVVTNNNTTDPNIGKKAVAGQDMNIYDLQGNVVRAVVKYDDLGLVTGYQGTNYIIDDNYLADMASTILR